MNKLLVIEKLRKEIIQILNETKAQIKQTNGVIIAQGYWRIGETLAANNELLESSESLATLASSLNIENSALYRSYQFYASWPNACPVNLYPQLTWSHYKELLSVKESALRDSYTIKANENRWSIRVLREAIKTKQLTSNLVSSNNNQTAILHRKKSKLHCYKASVERIVDGDTLLINIDLGFDVWTKKRLRLRGIDTPEKDTKKGMEATTFVQQKIPKKTTIVIQTFTTDLHGRYVSDVFYLPGSKNKETIFKEGIFLNQELLNKGYARLFGAQ